MVFIGSADDYCNTLEVKPWFFPPVGKMFLKMIQPGDFYYESKGKKNGKEMMPLEQKPLYAWNPYHPSSMMREYILVAKPYVVSI